MTVCDDQPNCMAQLNILSGRHKKHYVETGHFPVLIGRGAACHLQLEGLGVWERHAELDFRRGEGFMLRPASNATTLVNGEKVEGERRVRPRSLTVTEGLVWLGLVLVAALQAWLLWSLAF